MAGNYSRFGTSSPERIHSLITGAGPDQDLTTASSEGIMSRAPLPTPEIGSRFARRARPTPIVKSDTEDTGSSFLENFFIMLGRSADDPEEVANAVAPMNGDPAVDLGEWENMPPAPGRDSPTRQALGTVPRGSSTGSTNRDTAVFDMESALDEIMESEGGFQQWEEDRGNYVNNRLIGTNRGITPNALAEYRGVDPSTITVDDIKNISDEEAREIFLEKYYFANGLDRLPQHLQANVLDMYINSGTNAISILQDLLGVERDGIIGPETLKALENTNITNEMYANRRIQYYNAVARNRPSQRGFLRGWLNRASKYLQ
jgi:hypothetical protein